MYLGDIISEVKPQHIETFKKARVIVKNTTFNVPFNSKTDTFETLSKMLVHDSERNQLIVEDIGKELSKGKKAVIITERMEHVHSLYQFLKSRFEIIALSGEDNQKERESKWKSIQQGHYQAIITTGQYFGEGTDVRDISCLFLVYPFAFKGKLIQYIGRVQRSEITPIIYDYRDKKIPYLEKLFLKRNVYYRSLDRQATLFDDLGENLPEISKAKDIDKTIKVPINELDFHYGMVCFSYMLHDIQTIVQFEIENDEIQPEFEVLKPYFSKVLKSKYITARVQIGMENNAIVSQLATSADIDRINKEIIESVKFRFVEQEFIKKKQSEVPNQEELSKTLTDFYGSGNDLLDSLLNSNTYEHHRQLLYLSKSHCNGLLKIRFVTQPFSFVFLLKGQDNYHIVLETLDTKEATYLWHFPQSTSDFRNHLETVNKDLNSIRSNGRQAYLENTPVNFSRIIHDYSDDKKGFFKWKNALEERLI